MMIKSGKSYVKSKKGIFRWIIRKQQKYDLLERGIKNYIVKNNKMRNHWVQYRYFNIIKS